MGLNNFYQVLDKLDRDRDEGMDEEKWCWWPSKVFPGKLAREWTIYCTHFQSSEWPGDLTGPDTSQCKRTFLWAKG